MRTYVGSVKPHSSMKFGRLDTNLFLHSYSMETTDYQHAAATAHVDNVKLRCYWSVYVCFLVIKTSFSIINNRQIPLRVHKSPYVIGAKHQIHPNISAIIEGAASRAWKTKFQLINESERGKHHQHAALTAHEQRVKPNRYCKICLCLCNVYLKRVKYLLKAEIRHYTNSLSHSH